MRFRLRRYHVRKTSHLRPSVHHLRAHPRSPFHPPISATALPKYQLSSLITPVLAIAWRRWASVDGCLMSTQQSVDEVGLPHDDDRSAQTMLVGVGWKARFFLRGTHILGRLSFLRRMRASCLQLRDSILPAFSEYQIR